jgi:hypothetical protein
LDPSTDPGAAEELRQYNISPLTFSGGEGGNEERIEVFATLIIGYGDRAIHVSLLNRSLFGYQITDPESLEVVIEDSMENLIGINEEIGYLADHGTPTLFQGQTGAAAFTNLRNLISEDYTIKEVRLEQEDIPGGLNTLIIAGPRQKFTEYELYQIDQHLMKGGSLAVFIDTHHEYWPQGNMGLGGRVPPEYIPIESGLETLLEHYGVKVHMSYVMDEKCFVQRS